jgi:porin
MRYRRRRGAPSAACFVVTMGAVMALTAAATAAAEMPAPPGEPHEQPPGQQPGQWTGDQPRQPNAAEADFWHRENMTGEWGGVRKTLEEHGVTVSLTYEGELLANVAGGIKRGAAYEHEILGAVDVDLDKRVHWSGATFHVSAYDYAGVGLTRGFIGSLATVSGIEAPPPSVRLFTLWLEQQALDDRLAVKAGLLALDEERFTKTVPGDLFVGAMFGYPDGLGINLPAGGPVYPLSAPALLVEVKPVPILELRAAVSSGDPTGHNGATLAPQSTLHGTVIGIGGGALIAAEAVLPPDPKQEGVPTKFRFGGWYHTGDRFADQHFAGNGLSLADPAASGVPRNDAGDWAIYGTAEAMLYRVPGSKDQGLAAFARLAGLPAEQNVVSFYGDGGVTYKGLLPGRRDDTAGIAFAYLGVSPAAQALDRDTRRFGGNPDFPVRDHEIVFEATYEAAVAPWWKLQPALQHWLHPGGHVRNPDGRPRRDATVIGLRSTLQF